MDHNHIRRPVLKATKAFSSHGLEDCLRAAEADATRLHGKHAPMPYQRRRTDRRKAMAAALALLAAAAALVYGMGGSGAPPVTVAAAPAAPAQWFTAPSPDAPRDDEPTGDGGHVATSADGTPPVSGAAVASPAPMVDAPSPLVAIDGGDMDIAATVPASVLTETPAGHEPRVAPMNTPSVPDDSDNTPGEPDDGPGVAVAGDR